MTLSIIGGRWKAIILWHLRAETQRFSELRRLMPNITQRMLTNQLRELEEDGILTRTVYPEVPVRVEYALTESGRSLRPVLEALCAWGHARMKTD